jgi:hypothetical protein
VGVVGVGEPLEVEKVKERGDELVIGWNHSRSLSRKAKERRRE